ncbi:MAG: hypothetical protein F4Y57_05015 [Acidobacteria bacterium]|nr:hypothetical protein [Acidobacteriota bacterium]
MRAIGYLIIGVSLVLGAIAATTAYVPPLTADDSALAAGGGFAHLTARAGVQRDAAGELVLSAAGARIPLVPAGTELTPDVQARLRAAGVRRVRVREFAFGRWQHAWLFVLAVAGLVAGSALVRRDTARAQRSQRIDEERKPRGTPQAALAETIAVARGLQADLPALAADADRTRAIIERVGHVQGVLALRVVEGRDALVGALGMAGYAELMDAFSRLERALNRAWSAAADGVLDEALRCVDEAVALAPEVERRLGN